jgi:hypothetical protein
MAHIVGEVPSLRSIIPTLPKEIESILQKVLAKEPTERFQTPLEFAEALSPFASPEELWTLIQEAMPTDAATGSSPRHSSNPYTSLNAAKKEIIAPASRWKRITFFIALNLLLCGLITAGFVLYTAPSKEAIQTARIMSMTTEAGQAIDDAISLQKQWKMAEAQDEHQKAVRLMRGIYDQTNTPQVQRILLYYRVSLAMTRWYHGDTQTAIRNLDSILDSISNVKEEESKAELNALRKLVQERRADFTLFGGAASGVPAERFTERMITDRIYRYNEAAGKGERNQRSNVIRWKQAIFYSLLGKLDEAETLLKENPALPNETNLHATSVRQLAEAVLFYKRAGDYVADPRLDRDQKLRAFQRQFALPSNDVLRKAAVEPEMMELLLFCAEFLISDSLKQEDWQTLGEDFTTIYNALGGFLRQYPGATPFMRRFNELLVRSAVLLHEHSEQAREKRKHLDNLARLLERMRLSVGDSADGAKPTLIYFFLPESNKPEEGFVLFYPQDERQGVLYRLPLTRQMVKQGERLPMLDEQLLKQISMEKALQYKMRVSWDDTAAWSNTENALTEKDYPYKDVLPLR